ncbi:hypothetical protein GCM10027403_34350 [Arthrobacter tecti]
MDATGSIGKYEEMTTDIRFPVPPCAEPGAPSPLTATGEPLRWGVVATGGIARSVTEDLAQLEDAVLQAVSSRSEERARAFAEAHGFKTAHYDDGGARGFELSSPRTRRWTWCT